MSLLHHLFLPHHSNNQRAKLLHPSVLLLVIGLVVSGQIALSQVTRYYPAILGYASRIAPEEIVRLTNRERSNQGLPALAGNGLLNQAAARKAADMFARNYWAHVSPAGTQPWYFITQAGYSYRYAGENLARDFSDPQSVVTAWMNSPTHRDNLLSNRYQDIGVAVVDGTLEGRETTLVVQMFGTQLASVPVVSGQASYTVKAQAETLPAPAVVPSPVIQVTAPQITASLSTPFDLTRIVSFGILGILAVVLLIDVLVVNHKKIYRWTSKSLAHFIFIAMLIVAAATVIRGQIL